MTPHQLRALDELCTTVRMVFAAGTVSVREMRLRAFVREWVPERRPLPELAADANTVADAVIAEREACIAEIEHWWVTPRPHIETGPKALVASIRAGEHRDGELIGDPAASRPEVVKLRRVIDRDLVREMLGAYVTRANLVKALREVAEHIHAEPRNPGVGDALGWVADAIERGGAE